MSDISGRLLDMGPDEKRALLAQLLRKRASKTTSFSLLSYGQRALWFLRQSAPESAAYNLAIPARIHSHVDVPALQRACQALINRHASLRTIFPVQDGQPLQEVLGYQEVCFEEIDASTWTWDELNQHVAVAHQRPFDLERGPVLRVHLFTRSAQDHVLLLTMHHIVCDGWSIWILLNELRELYPAERTGIRASLPPQSLSYTDYVHWQTDMLAGPEGERLLAYWQKQLSGELPTLNLPTNQPRPPVQTFHGASYAFTLPAELSQRLRALARAEGVTLYMTLLAALFVQLYRYTDQEDILVGSPATGRTRSEFAEIVGYFVNQVVLRADLAGNPTFKAFLSQVHHTVLDAIAHQDCPFPLLVERLQPKRDPSRSPIFQVSFLLQTAQQPGDIVDVFTPGETKTRVNWGGLEIELLDLAQQEGLFDLMVEMVETPKALRGVFKYNSDLFEATTIIRMATHLETLLTGLVTHPTQRVSDLPLLSDAERQQLLVQWNDRQTAYLQDQCLHQRFEAQVACTPEAVAVVCDSQQLTYRSLNRRANQLAHHLRMLGVGPEVLVGIYMERSLEMVIGLLGILKAGGAYVPLDPAYPLERLAFMLADAQVRVLLTQVALVAGLPTQGVSVVCLDRDWGTISQEREENPISGVAPANTAYIIYTSGSTGQPKGVVVPHTSVGRLFAATQDWFHFDVQDVWTLFHSYAFDFSVWELWGALLYGGRLIVAPTWVSQVPTAFYDTLIQEGVTVLNQTPSAFRQLVRMEEESAETGLALRLLIFGGEALELQSLQPWFARHGDQRPQLVNMYGITETTVHVTYRPLTLTDLSNSGSMIGVQIPDLQVYLLDRHLQPVPIGIPGEMYIGGAGVTRGYLRRPGLTAERFIPNPFSPHPGARLYKTGDLARYRSSGDLEYLGRLDEQVKIRGFRIELGEIATVLAQHPAVQETIVIAQQNHADNTRLVAYVVPRSGPAATTSALRLFLQAKLPPYMVPAAYVWLEKLPLTPNGKVDYRALPVSDSIQRSVEADFVAPRTPTEELLAGIWAAVLGLEQVGVDDNFFDLGGHSLLATQLASRLRNTFAIEIPVRRVFEVPTLAALSTYIDDAQRVDQPLSVPPLIPVVRQGDLPLSFAQQRLWFLDQLEGGGATYNIPAALRLSGPLHVAALAASLTAIMRRHEALRTTFPAVQGVPVQVITPSQPVPLPMVDLRALATGTQEAEVHLLAMAEARRPFALAQDALLRVSLLRLHEEEHILLLTVHHIVSDGWSIGVVVRELAALYTACCRSEVSPLPELPIQYADFAHWQRSWLQGEVLETQLAYWQKQLAGAPAVLDLPSDCPRRPVQRFCGGVQLFCLGLELTQQLVTLSRQAGVTLYMLLLGAFATFLARYSDREDIIVGSPIANRTRQEIEGLIGFFVNTLVLRINLTGNPTFLELLARVRQVTLEAYAHQDLPFEKLVEELQPERDLSHPPLFQVSFALQNAPRAPLELPGLTLTLLDTESGTSKFDLTLSMEETAQGLQGYWEYNSDLFEAATVRRMASHFETLLTRVVVHPEWCINEIPLLTDAERRQLLVDWNNTRVAYPQEQSLHQWFAAQVERTPDAIAVVYDDQQLTYQTLNRRANQLAHYLRALGVGPEVLVGLCLERSLELVVGIFGILKAGGAYLPLDPAYPKERLAFMLKDSQTPVLLTEQRLVAGLPAHEARMVCLDTDWGAIVGECEENSVSSVAAEHIAYAIYTSGSTGQPKGVLIPHRAIVNHMLWMQEAFPLTVTDRVVQKTPFCFDASVWEFFAPLFAGAQLVMARPGGHQDPAYLVQLLAEQQVTVLQLVPSLLQALLDEEGLAACTYLQRVFCGGEALAAELQEWFFTRLPTAGLYNLYGPTEASIDATFWACERGRDRGAVPIGRPIANTETYILDRQEQLAPIGMPGELHIGGVGLARGYLKRPALTAEKFIPHPWSEVPGARLYKTGDLARYLSDGALEFRGRVDHQVKVRGFRIELGEIERVLTQHPAVETAIVLAREDHAGDKRLVGYIVPAPYSQARDAQDTGPDTQTAQIAQWQQVFDETYRQPAPEADPTFNIIGWNDSYTGQPIPSAEMRVWVESTVERIRAWQPQCVLEIGCGTGLLLFRLAPHCTEYWGTDFAPEALRFVEQQLQQAQTAWPQVRLSQRPADDFTGVAAAAYDTVILNSVVQYFPSIDYLLSVLEGAVRATVAGGIIFVGDVRSLPLLEAFYVSVQVQQAPEGLLCEQLRQRVREAMRTETELVIDPAFFTALQRHLPQISHVDIQLKRGDAHNQLTQFRYDVVLHVGAKEAPLAEVRWLDWQKAGLTVARLRRLLDETAPEVLGIRDVPNARVMTAVQLVELLGRKGGPATVGELRASIEELPQTMGVEPEAIWALSQDVPYAISISWSGAGALGCYDVICQRRPSQSGAREILPLVRSHAGRVRPWRLYATHPVQGQWTRQLFPQLRQYLIQTLPDYMMPAAFVLLEELPLTPNGKVDRRALPAPDTMRRGLEADFVAPRTPTEELLADLWVEVLGREQIGIHDNFFVWGGHSLLATQLLSRVRDAFQMELPLRSLFEAPTVADFAEYIETVRWATQEPQVPPGATVGDREEGEL